MRTHTHTPHTHCSATGRLPLAAFTLAHSLLAAAGLDDLGGGGGVGDLDAVGLPAQLHAAARQLVRVNWGGPAARTPGLKVRLRSCAIKG